MQRAVEESFPVEVVTEAVDGFFPDDDEYAAGDLLGKFVEFSAEVSG